MYKKKIDLTALISDKSIYLKAQKNNAIKNGRIDS